MKKYILRSQRILFFLFLCGFYLLLSNDLNAHAQQRYTIAGGVFEDLNGDGLLQSEIEQFSRKRAFLFLDINHNGSYDKLTQTFFPTDTPRKIPANSSILSPITVAEEKSFILDVHVTLEFEHSRICDLSAVLISPQGTRVPFFTQGIGNCGAQAGIMELTDSARIPVNEVIAPLVGTFLLQPTSSFRSFYGEDPSGIWKLEFQNIPFCEIHPSHCQIEGFTGDLIEWSLTVTHGDPHTYSNNNGRFAFTNLLPREYELWLRQQNDFLVTTPAQQPVNLFQSVVVNTLFGIAKPGTIRGTVKTHETGNPLNDWLVYIDLDNNGLYDQLQEPMSITDIHGKYSFYNLFPRIYTIRQIPQARWTAKNPEQGFLQVTMESGQTISNVDFWNQADLIPHTTGIWVDSTQWSDSFRNHLKQLGVGGDLGFRIQNGVQTQNLPWVNLNTIHIAFSQHIPLRSEDLFVIGTKGIPYPIQSFEYNPQNNTASWILKNPIGSERLRFWLTEHIQTLLGTIENNSFPAFRMHVLPGDTDHSGRVDILDGLNIRSRLFSNPNEVRYAIECDLNGSGSINIFDGLIVRNAFFTLLP